MTVLDEFNRRDDRHGLIASLIASVFAHGGRDDDAVFDALEAHELGLDGKLALEVGFRLEAVENTAISAAARTALNVCRMRGPLALELARELAEARILEGPEGVCFDEQWLARVALDLAKRDRC